MNDLKMREEIRETQELFTMQDPAHPRNKIPLREVDDKQLASLLVQVENNVLERREAFYSAVNDYVVQQQLSAVIKYELERRAKSVRLLRPV